MELGIKDKAKNQHETRLKLKSREKQQRQGVTSSYMRYEISMFKENKY